MKICFYALRPFDELAYCKQFSEQYGIDFTWTAEYPTADNVELAKGCDAVCMTVSYTHLGLQQSICDLSRNFGNISFLTVVVVHKCLLQHSGCHALYHPTVREIHPAPK